jgi:predicted transcriptional regulator
MARLMEVSASAISRYIHGQLSSLDLWTTPYPKVERFLTYGLRVCR